MRKVLILVFVFMTLMGYAQDYPKLKPLKEDNLEENLFLMSEKGNMDTRISKDEL